jgi:hypothetical protein
VDPGKDEAELKVSASTVLLASAGTLHTLVLGKRWVLFEPPPGERFWISDNPITPHHSGEAPEHAGSLALASPGSKSMHLCRRCFFSECGARPSNRNSVRGSAYRSGRPKTRLAGTCTYDWR